MQQEGREKAPQGLMSLQLHSSQQGEEGKKKKQHEAFLLF